MAKRRTKKHPDVKLMLDEESGDKEGRIYLVTYWLTAPAWEETIDVELEDIGHNDWQITFSSYQHPEFTSHPEVDHNGMARGFTSRRAAKKAAELIASDMLPKQAAVPRIPASKKGDLRQAELKSYVSKWLAKTDGPGGNLLYDAEVYTGKQWGERGEEYSNGATVVVTTEGPLYKALNYGFEETPAFRTEKLFREFLEALGYYYELGYAWSVGVFPL